MTQFAGIGELSVWQLSWAATGLILVVLGAGTSVVQAKDPHHPYLAVARAAAAPEIDGVLDDDVWKTASCVPFLYYTRGFLPESPTTRTFFAWDDENLYVAYDCAEPLPDQIKLRGVPPRAVTDEDDCVELRIQSPGMELYYELVINSAGLFFDARHFDRSWESNARCSSHVGKDSWTVELSIPWDNLGQTPKPDQLWRTNLRRHRYVGGQSFRQWSRTGPESRSPHAFGYMRFVDSAPAIHQLELGYEQPGLNRLTALASSPIDGARLLVLHAEGEQGASSVSLRVGPSGSVDLTYPITSLSRDALMVELADAQQSYFRQAVRVTVTPSVSAGQVNEGFDLLTQKAASTRDDPFKAALEGARAQGEKHLAELQLHEKAAVDAGQIIDQEVWERAAAPVLRFQQLMQQPTLWTRNPFLQSRPEMMPSEVEVLDHIDIAAAINEQEAGSLLVTNLFAREDVDLRVELGEVERIEGDGARPLTRSNIELAEVLMIPTRAHGVIADPVSTLNKAGVIHVPLDQTREVWFLVDTTDLSPGFYRAPVSVHPLVWDAGVLSAEFELRIRIWDIELPKKMPIAVYNFDYTRALAGHSDYMSDLARCRANVFQVTNIPNPDDQGDFSRLDPVLERLPEDGQAMMEVWFMRSHGWQPRFETWVRKLAQYMKSRGLSYDRWFLHIFDESASDDFLECARQVKRVDPKVRISQDHMGTPERLSEFASVIDIWIPLFRDLDKPGLETMRATGKPVWTYDCGTTPLFSTARHRFLPWRAWRYNLDGVTLWTYSQSHWNDPPRHGHNFGMFFGAADGGAVPSKRFEAWRDGVEDYLYLVVYEAELRKLSEPTPQDEELLEQARELGAENPADIQRYDQVRTHIAHRILGLRGNALESDFGD